MSKRVTKRVTCTLLLPTPIITAIESSTLKPAQKAKALKFIGLFLKWISIGEIEITDYKLIPSTYFRKTFKDGTYQVWIDELIKIKVVQIKRSIDDLGNSKETYKQGKGGFPKAYKINPEMFSTEFKEISYSSLKDNYDLSTITINDIEYSTELCRQDYHNLIFPRHELLELAKKIANNIDITRYQINDQIENTYIARVRNAATGYDGISNSAKCKESAEKYGMDFIKADTDSYHIKKAADFIKDKRKNALISYQYSINKLCNKQFYFSRNGKVKRLNHNLTSLHKELMSYIMLVNDLTEIDLSNSQFAILAYIMKNDSSFIKTPDFEIFLHEASKGTLYQYIGRLLEMTFEAVKTMMMETSFSSYKNYTKNKTRLMGLFPSVVKYIDDYKKAAKKSNEFAIMLQNKEAEIFVDNIYHQLKQEGLFCLTKHDSLIVRRQDASHILEVVNEYFKKIGFQCNLKNDFTAHNFDSNTKTIKHIQIEKLSPVVPPKMAQNNFVEVINTEAPKELKKPEERLLSAEAIDMGFKDLDYYIKTWERILGQKTAYMMYEEQFTKVVLPVKAVNFLKAV